MCSKQIIVHSGRRHVLNAAVASLLLSGMVFTTVAVHTQEMPVPAQIQLPLLLKVLSADRNLRERAGDELVIGVFYQARYRASMGTMETLFEIVGKSLNPPFPDQPVRFVPVPIESDPNWDSLITALDLDVCYVAPLRAMGIGDLLLATRSNHAVSCTGVPEYVESGVSVGFDTHGGKPQIVINVGAAKAEGIDFTSQLLKLARIIENG